jgi:hypothetical protein
MPAQPNIRLVFIADERAAKYKSTKAAACVQLLLSLLKKGKKNSNFSYLRMEKGKKKESVQLWTHMCHVPSHQL